MTTAAESLARAEAEVTRLQAAAERASRHADSLTVPEMAAVSGIRRKPNHKADRARYGAYDKAAEAYRLLRVAEQHRDALQRLADREARDAETKAGITPERLAAATHVRTKFGWEPVVRVNPKSVTVAANWPMDPRRVPLSDVLEVRP